MFSGPATGLWTSPNKFSAVPEGSLKVADNVDFVAPSVIEPTRGRDYLADSDFGDADSLADQLAQYGTNLLCAYDFTRIAIRPSTGGFFEWGQTFEPNGTNRMRFEPAARSIFFNPTRGIQVFDGLEGFSVGTGTAVGRALDYSGGAGDLPGSGVVTGDTSAAEGTLAFPPTDVVSGTMFFTAVSGGPFTLDEPLTGDAGWTGDAEGVDYPSIVVAGPAAAFTVGANVAGETSGAFGTIVSRVVDGSDVYLGLSSVVGTFQVERVAVGASSLEPVPAGCPQGLNVVAIPNSDNGWMPPDTAVAYRFTICRKDAFGRVIEGPPSGRTTLRNLIAVPIGSLERDTNEVAATVVDPTYLKVGDVVTLRPGEADFPAGAKTLDFATTPTSEEVHYAEMGADALNSVVEYLDITRSADLKLYFPDDVNATNFLRVYRSLTTLAAEDVPSDELFQVYESAYLSQAELAAGFLSFNDVTPESVLEVPLYTNSNTGDGTLAANFQPPIAEDLVYWQDRMWVLNTTEKESAQLALIGVGSPDGLQEGDVLSFIPAGGTIADVVEFEATVTPSGPNEFQLFLFGDPGYNIQRTAQALAQVMNDSTEDVPYALYISSETGAPGKLLLQARTFGDAHGFSVCSSRGTTWTPQLPSAAAPAWAPLKSTNNRHAARLAWGKLGQPEAFPLLNTLQIEADNAPGLRMFKLNYRLIIFKTDGIYFVPAGFPVSQQKLSDHVLIAPGSVQRLGDTLYALTDQGLIAIDNSGVRQASTAIDDTFAALAAPAALEDLRERSVAVAYRSAKRYLLWTIERDDEGDFSEDNTQAFVRSALSNGFTRYTFGVRAAIVDTTNDKLLFAPTDDNRLIVERKTLTDADYVGLEGAAIPCEVVFNDLTEGEPATMKLAQQCSFLFRENGITTITALFASEIHPAQEEVPIITEGWGGFSWGEVPWGGYVRAIRLVQPIPPAVAECCQLSVGFRTAQAGKKFSFLGIDVVAGESTEANYG